MSCIIVPSDTDDLESAVLQKCSSLKRKLDSFPGIRSGVRFNIKVIDASKLNDYTKHSLTLPTIEKTTNKQNTEAPTVNCFDKVLLKDNVYPKPNIPGSFKCSVKGCSTFGDKDIFYRFPEIHSGILRSKWVEACGLSQIHANSRVCAKHFDESQFTLKDRLLDVINKRKRLIKDAIPTLHIPIPTITNSQMEKVHKNISIGTQTDNHVDIEIKKLIEKIGFQRSKEERINESLKKFFTPGQIRKLYSPNTSTRWRKEDISAALSLYRSGPQAYEYLLQKSFPMPHTSTIHKWVAKMKKTAQVINESLCVNSQDTEEILYVSAQNTDETYQINAQDTVETFCASTQDTDEIFCINTQDNDETFCVSAQDTDETFCVSAQDTDEIFSVSTQNVDETFCVNVQNSEESVIEYLLIEHETI